MKTTIISKHKNYQYLKNLNIETEDKFEFLINGILDFCDEEDSLVNLLGTYKSKRNFHWIEAQTLVSGTRFQTVLYKGKLCLFKKDMDELTKIKSGTRAMKLAKEHCLCKYEFKPGNVLAHQHFQRLRSYFISFEETMEKLNIDIVELNELIRQNIIRVNIYAFQVFFLSYQVEELLHILKVGPPDVYFFLLTDKNSSNIKRIYYV